MIPPRFLMIKLMSTMMAVILPVIYVPVAGAQDFGKKPESQAEAPALKRASPSDADGNDAENPAVVQSALQKKSMESPKTSVNLKTAEELAREFIDAAVDARVLETGEGWNEAQRVFVATGVATLKTPNPAADKVFLDKRALLSRESSLLAKRTIIEYVRTELSAADIVVLPESGLGTEFDRQRAELETLLERSLADLGDAMSQVQAKRAEELKGVTAADILVQGAAGLIRKYIDPELNLQNIDAGKKQKLAAAAERFNRVQAQVDLFTAALKKQRDALQQTNETVITTLSRMSVVGSMMVAQFESWKDGDYQMATVFSWSPKQEREIRNLMAGRPSRGKPGTVPLAAYIRGNDWSTAIGGRKHLDEKGDLHVIGIGAVAMTGTAGPARRQAETLALRLAQSDVAYAMMSDVSAQSEAKLRMTQSSQADSGAGSNAESVRSVAEKLAQSVNLSLQGVQRRYSAALKHPITNQNMFVVIVSASASQSAIAAEMEKALFSGAAEIRESQQRSAGVRAGMEAVSKERAADPHARNQGEQQGRAAMTKMPDSVLPAASPAAPAAAPSGTQSRGQAMEKGVTGAGSSPKSFTF